MQTFRDWLRKVIEDRGLKQQTLAEQVGVSQAAVSGWLNSTADRDKPRAESLIRLAEVTTTDPHFLFSLVYGLPMPGENAELDERITRIMRQAEQMTDEDLDRLEDYLDYLITTRAKRERQSKTE
jgi:transcriptional regulator with XRE-family HTH domain